MKRSGWNWRKSLALLLSIIMMVGLLPLSAFAEEGEDAADSVAVGEASTPIETTETMPAQDESAEETPVPASPIEETSEPTEPEETPAPTEPEETPAPTEAPEATEAPTEAPTATNAPAEEPIETPAPTMEPTPEPTGTPEPTPIPTPDYIFEQETVYLTEILEAVKKTITENSTLSVDCDSIRLSETEVEIEDEESRTLTGSP